MSQQYYADKMPGDKILESVIAKIHRSTQRDAELCDIAESSGGLNKLNVTVYPRMELIDFYGDYPAPDSNYSPQSVKLRTDVEKLTDYRQEVKLEGALKKLKDGTMTVVGPAGSGKSTLLKAIAQAVIAGQQEVLAGVKIVHFLQGRDLDSLSEMASFRLLLHNVDLDEEEVECYLKFVREHPSKVLFVIDSLDTFPYALEKQCKRISLREKANPGTTLWNFLTGNIFGGCKIITSSREYTIRDYKGKLRSKNIVALAGLTIESIQEIVRGYFPGEHGARKVLDRLSRSPSLQNMCSIPVFLSFTMVGFNVEAEFNPRTMTGILVLVLQSLVHSDHSHVENIVEVIHKLKALAMEGTKGKRVLFSTNELAAHRLEEEVVTDLTIFTPGLVASQKFVKKESSLFFNHQSLQELLSAYFIAEMDRDGFAQFLQTDIHKPHYAVVRRILCGIVLDEEIESTARQFFTRPPDSDHKRLLIESLNGQISKCEDEDALELLLSFHEAGSVVNAALQFNLPSVDLRRVTFSPGDMHALGSVISRCKRLENLNLPFSNLNPHLLEVLNSVIQSGVKIDAIDVSGNATMETKGIRHVGDIVRRCQPKKLSLSSCDLTSEQLIALQNSLGNTKVETLVFSQNRSMGREGFSRIGEIVKNCDVATITLIGCEFTGEELTAFLTSLGSCEIARLVATEHDTCQKGGPPPTEEICLLLSNITEEVDLGGLVVKDEDIQTIQITLNQLQRAGLEVRVGPAYNYEKLVAGRVRQPRPTTDPLTQRSAQPGEIDLSKYDQANEEILIEADAGGTVKLHGCTLDIPPNTLKRDSIVKVTVSNEGSSVPDRYQIISPAFTCTVQGNANVIRPRRDFQAVITSWCSADVPFKIFLLQKTHGRWQKDRSLTLGRNRSIHFTASTFSQWVLAFEPTTEAKRVLRYRIYTCVCYNDLASYVVHCSIDDDFTIHRITEKAQTSFSFVLPQSVKMDDVIEISSPESSPVAREFSEKEWGFEFHGIFKSTCSLSMEFRLNSPHENVKNGFLEFSLMLRKNSGLVANHAKCRIALPDESTSGSRKVNASEDPLALKQECHEECLESVEEHSTQDANEVENYIQRLRENIETNIKRNVKKRIHIGPEGGLVQLFGCSVLFPPNALETVTPVHLEVGSCGKNLPVGYVPLTPIVSCSISGKILHRDVTMKLPVYCIVASDAFVVLTKKRNEWKAIENTKLNAQDFEIEIEIRHFCETAAFVETDRSSAATQTSKDQKSTCFELNIMNRLYYKADVKQFIWILHVDEEKTKNDCLAELGDAELVKLTVVPIPIHVKSEDVLTFEVCDGGRRNFTVNVKNILDTKYDVKHFSLPANPNVKDGLYSFEFSMLVNDELVKGVPFSLPLYPEQVIRRERSLHVVPATEGDYVAHLDDESIYQFPKNRKKGTALIINNYRFKTDHDAIRMGSDVDVNLMNSLWTKLGLQVSILSDLTAEEMRGKVRSFVQESHEISLCVAIVMSHGDKDGDFDVLTGQDRVSVKTDDILREFDDAHCKHLKGIPKLIFLQCCRGAHVATDGADANSEPNSGNIALDSSLASDRLVVYATQSDHVAFRNSEEGSWFINELAHVFASEAHNCGVLDMLSRVNGELSKRRASSEDESVRQGRQIGEKNDSFRKKLFLFPGWPSP